MPDPQGVKQPLKTLQPLPGSGVTTLMPLSDDPTSPDGDRDSLAGHHDPIIQQAALGLRLWGQLKQIEPPDKAFHAVADLDTEALRAVVTHHLFAWHQQAGTAEGRRADPA
jgi:hypothetical protein